MSDLTEWLRCRIEQARNHCDDPYASRDTRAEYESEIQHLSDAASDSALLDRVRSECDVRIEKPWDANEIQHVTVQGPPDLLRQLAERLGRG